MKILPLLVLLLPLVSVAHAGHRFFCTDSYGGKVAIVAADGTIEWEYACKHPQDCWILPDGHLLFCHSGGALELTPEGRTIWEYKAPENCEVHSCQPLPDGRVLVVECGTSRIVEVDRNGNVAKEIKLTPPPANIKLHDQYRGTRKTLAGHYLVSRKGEHEIEELDGDGRSLRRIPVPGDVHSVVELPNQHWLVSLGDGHKVIELDEKANVVWELNENDVPGNPLRLMTGVQRLPNGNTIYCNYLGHGHLADSQPHVFELDPAGKVVWEFADHEHFKTVNQIQVFDVPGDATKGEILR